jgi:hypothetical protein
VSIPHEVAQQALEALEIGNACAEAEAAQYHAAMAGYRPHRHAQMDADVQKIAQTITALRAALEQPNECRWLQEGDEESDTWAASCGRHRYFSLNEGTPKDNHMRHCCYCGKPLVEVPIEEDEA